MSHDITPVPPEAAVIRLARLALGMTAESAAAASRAHGSGGVSAAYWRDVERGQGGRRGQRVPTRASARALAAMARTVGVTPMAYLLAWRMALAKHLLRKNETGVAAIAERIGYSSASTFSVAFTRHVGQPPTHYAREHVGAPVQDAERELGIGVLS